MDFDLEEGDDSPNLMNDSSDFVRSAEWDDEGRGDCEQAGEAIPIIAAPSSGVRAAA